jgi:DNA-binding transcriptional ArsR family regulator
MRRREVVGDSSTSTRVFAALGDQTRFSVVLRLSRDGPASITRLAEGFPMTRQAITKHLRILERAGVVSSTAEGREILWRVEQRPLTRAKRDLDAIARQWEGTLQRLKSFVER